MSKIMCFGEIMLRLNPEGYLRLLQAERFEASYAGGEANVAVSLANYGEDVSFVSKVPLNDMGQNAINALRKYGVDTKEIVRGGPRLGIYFVEKGASQRGSKVIYDRSGSSIALVKRAEFDWDKILEKTCWFHFTGITPALGGDLPNICLDAIKKAKEKNITVSCDLNYRSKLWSKTEAKEVMSVLMPYVDICIANEEDASDVFGISSSDTDISTGKLSKTGYEKVAKELYSRFNLRYVAITLRGSHSANDNNWSGLLYDGQDCFFAKEYSIHIVDRVGGGDSFVGGLIHALLQGINNQDVIEYAVAASCLKHTIEFDFNHVNEFEIQSLVNGNTSGRVQR